MCASVIWAMSCKCLQKKSFEENAYGVYTHAKKCLGGRLECTGIM